MMKRLSRREFLAGAGGFAAGATVGAVLGGGFLGGPSVQAAEVALPWPYVELDPEVARKRGYEMTKSSGS